MKTRPGHPFPPRIRFSMMPFALAAAHLLALAASRPAATAADATNIVFIGDSITQGGNGKTGNIKNNPAWASYRYPLYFQLTGAGCNVNFVGPENKYEDASGARPLNDTLYPDYNTTFDRDHAAYWGKTSGALLNAAQTGFLAWANAIPAADIPDIAVINLGTNDASGGVAASTYTDNLATIIGKLRAANPRVTIILSNLIGTTAAWDTSIQTYNTAIANFAANPANRTATSGIVMADIRTGFDRTNWLYDNLHPDEAGEAFIANVYYHAITGVLTGVPEPATCAALAGAAALATMIRRRRHQRRQRCRRLPDFSTG
jgi:lysophospholipase L1-like esterase